MSVAIRYIVSWLNGVGAAAIDNLMEDAATAEISRSQLWQWTHAGTIDERRHCDHARVRALDRGEVRDGLRAAIG